MEEDTKHPVQLFEWLCYLCFRAMILLVLTYALLGSGFLGNGFAGALEDWKHGSNNQEAFGSGIDRERYRTACPDYKHYSVVPQYVW